MSEQSLFDRLVESAKDIRQMVLNGYFVQTMLTIGEMNDRNIAIAHKLYKNAIDIMLYILKLFGTAIELAENAEEKQIFINDYNQYEQTIKQISVDFQKVFGQIDPKLLAQPMSAVNASHVRHLDTIAKSGSIVNILSALLVGYVFSQDMYDYVRQQPHYKPNPFVEFFTFQSFPVKEGIETIKGLIDKRAPVSEAVEQHMIDTFRTGYVYEQDFYSNT